MLGARTVFSRHQQVKTAVGPDSTIADLPMHDFRVEASTLGETLSAQFQESPELPGAIVTEESRVCQDFCVSPTAGYGFESAQTQNF